MTFSLHHLLRRPLAESANPPLLLLLHGVGSHEHDLFSLSSHLPDEFLVISARAPLTVGPGQYAWYPVQFLQPGEYKIEPQAGIESRERIKTFITEVCAAYSVDSQRVYLMGFSQGAIMSHSILNSTPALLAGVAAMSGRMIPELFEDAAPRETMKDFPLLVTHGTHDGVIPIQEGRAIKAHYEALPVALEYHEFEMAHEINQQALNTILNWLEQRLNDQKT